MGKMLKSGGATALALVAAVAIAACGSSSGSGSSTGTGKPTASSSSLPGKGKPTIVLGDKNFTEEFILGDLYQQALQAKGYTVNLKADIGGSEIINTALQSHKINMYPEYTGEIALTLERLKRQPSSAAATYQDAQRWENARGNTLLKRTPFQDANTMAVLPSFAKKYHLTSIADLKNVGPGGKGVVYGDFPENRTRYPGLLGLKEAYGLKNIQFKGMDPGLFLEALKQGSINMTDVDTTQTVPFKVTRLKDPKGIFGFQNVAPVVNTKLLKEEGPAFTQTVNAVSAKLTDKVMTALDYAVSNDKDNASTVAHRFLKANGLL